MNRSHLTVRKEKGTVLALIAAGLVCLLGAAALAVDMGFLFIVQNQLQNAVDAAALAGGHGLLADPGDFSSHGRATQLAIQAAAKNQAAGQPVNLTSREVSFPDGHTVQVQITRPAPTFFGRVLGVSSVNIQVQATAIVAPIAGAGGMRPWTILDQFGHGALCVPPNDEEINPVPHGPFNETPHTWNGVTVASDHYAAPYESQFDGMDLSQEADCATVTGFIAPRDVNGVRITLKQGHPITPGNFGAVALGYTGASTYSDNIIYGHPDLVQIGDVLETETGNMVGVTEAAVDALIAQDPSAQMVSNAAGNWQVVSSQYPVNENPRIVPIPLYSVFTGPTNGRTNFTVTSIGAFFIEGSDGQEVWGRFVQSRSRSGQAGTPIQRGNSRSVGGGGRLLATVRLVE